MTDTKFSYRIGNFSVLFLQDKEYSSNLACVTLLVLLVVTLIFNSFVLLSVLLGNLKCNPYNWSIATLAAISVLDGIFNVTSSIVFHASWIEIAEQYGENTARVWCRTNAMTLQLTSMVQSFAFCILVYDRRGLFVARGEEYTRKKDKLLKWMLFASVIVSVIMALPALFGIFTASFFEDRMSCSPANVTETPTTLALAILISATYLSVWLFTLRVSFLIVKKVLNDRRRLIDLNLVARLREAEGRSTFGNTPNSNMELWSRVSGNYELPLFILTGLLTISFILAVVPNVIAVQITQFYNTYDESLDFYFANQTLPPWDLRQIRTDLVDSAFLWTRYGYNTFLPVFIFLMHSEVRKQCSIMFCCFQNCNGPSVFTKRKKTKAIVDNATPVLFATSEGLHLRILEKHTLNEEPLFLVKFCDLVLNQSQECRETRETSFVKLSENTRTEARLNETFVVAPRKSFSDTYVKLTNVFDKSKNLRDRKNTIELDLIAENSSSMLDLSQRSRHSEC